MHRNRYLFNSTSRFCSISYFKDRLCKTLPYLDDGHCILAKSYDELFKCNGKNILDVINSMPSLPDSNATDALQLKTDFNNALPNIIRTFLKCDNAEYKDNIKTIISEGFFDIKDRCNNNLLHMLAEETSLEGKNVEIYRYVLENNSKDKIAAMSRETNNLSIVSVDVKITPCEIAVANNNVDFITMMRQMHDLPKRGDLKWSSDYNFYLQVKNIHRNFFPRPPYDDIIKMWTTFAMHDENLEDVLSVISRLHE